jgi:hypothetical protein
MLGGLRLVEKCTTERSGCKFERREVVFTNIFYSSIFNSGRSSLAKVLHHFINV